MKVRTNFTFPDLTAGNKVKSTGRANLLMGDDNSNKDDGDDNCNDGDIDGRCDRPCVKVSKLQNVRIYRTVDTDRIRVEERSLQDAESQNL